MSRKTLYEPAEIVEIRKKGDKIADISVDDFAKIYSETSSHFMCLRSVQEIKLAVFLTARTQEGNLLTHLEDLLKEFAEEYQQIVGVAPSPTRLRGLLSSLTGANVLFRLGRGKYMVNPRLSWRGEEKARRECIMRMHREGFTIIFNKQSNATDKRSKRVQGDDSGPVPDTGSTESIPVSSGSDGQPQ